MLGVDDVRGMDLYVQCTDGSTYAHGWGDGAAGQPGVPAALLPADVRGMDLYVLCADGSMYAHDWGDGAAPQDVEEGAAPPVAPAVVLKTHAPTPGALLPLAAGGATPCSQPVWEDGVVSWYFEGVLEARVVAAWAAISSVNTALCADAHNRAHVFASPTAWEAFALTASGSARTIFIHDLLATCCV
jgi:hypothetical protein